MSDDLNDRWQLLAAIALFAAIVLLIAWDLSVDYGEGAGWVHIAIELLVLIVAASGMAMLWRLFYAARGDLSEAREEAERWREENRELLKGLGAAIETQFDRWQLTRAEADVGMLLLKGLGHKEIAALRNTSERTVREQARTLYRKAGLSGRSSLSAFFLEDLLTPPQID